MTRRPDTIDLRRPADPVMPSACASGGCGGGGDPRPVFPSFGRVAVNGVEIDPDAIALEIQHHPAPDAETAWREAARALAVRELLLQEVRRLGLDAEPEPDGEGRCETVEDALIQALLEREVEAECAGEDECRRYYDANSGRFRTPDLFEAAHILIEPDGTGEAAWALAETRAHALAEALGDDPVRFAAAAREQSGCASAQQDGSLGQIRRGELMPAVQAAIEALDEGTTARLPVRSRHGWHIVRLQRRIPGQTLPFEAVRERIADMLEARSWTVQSVRYVAGLADRGEVVGIAIAGDG
jgi:peptidyl-prolyl cis-trans isomerase C